GIVRSGARVSAPRRFGLEVPIGQVSVEDLPRDSFRERRGEREERERETPVLRARGTRVQEKDHARLTIAARPTGQSATAGAFQEDGLSSRASRRRRCRERGSSRTTGPRAPRPSRGPLAGG